MTVNEIWPSESEIRRTLAIAKRRPETAREHGSVLFVGTRKELDHWMWEQGMSPTEHGRSVFWAQNGPQHLERAHGWITVVAPDPERELNEFEVACLEMAKWLNEEEVRI